MMTKTLAVCDLSSKRFAKVSDLLEAATSFSSVAGQTLEKLLSSHRSLLLSLPNCQKGVLHYGLTMKVKATALSSGYTNLFLDVTLMSYLNGGKEAVLQTTLVQPMVI